MRGDPRTLSAALRGAAWLLAGVAIAAVLILAVSGGAAGSALSALWRGSLGSPAAFFSGTLVRATPLLFAGLAVTLAFRAGILNIGAEGQLLVGAAAAAAVALRLWTLPFHLQLVAALAAAAIAGALWAAVAATLRRRFGVLEVISTLMLNFIALHLLSFLVRGPLQEPSGIYPQTLSLAPAMRLPVVVPGTRLHAGFLLALVCALSIWWVLRHTAAGFRLRASGANADAAASAGRIDVAATTTAAFLVSGALAGIAGAVEVTGVTFALYENISPGYGYSAIAVALLARLHPLAVIGTAVLFGALEAGAGAMQRDAGVPAEIVKVAEALLILLVIAADRLRGGDAMRSRRAAPASPATAGAVA